MNKTVQRGLSENEVIASREKYGSNRMTPPKRKSFIAHFIGNLGDPVIKILLFALVVNMAFISQPSDWIETIGIALSVFLATFISTISECGSENAFSRLNAENENYLCRVRRGDVVRLPIEELVVGDIVLLSAGDKIPADGFLISGKLGVGQAAMTGESREVEKRPHAGDKLSPNAPSALLRECEVMSGEGEMEIAVVGDKTFIGEISREIVMDTRESPLKLRLRKLAVQISRLGYAAAVLVALVYLFNNIVLESGMHPAIIITKLSDVRYLFSTVLNAFMLGLTVVVMAVPEGLPTMIAVVLSSNMKRMVRDMVLVRKPVGIEAAGSMNLLFTDKTGTLTEGALSVTRLFTDCIDCRTTNDLARANKAVYDRLLLTARFNTNAEFSQNRAIGGNSTEQSLLLAFARERNTMPCRVLSKDPFDSTKKYSSATVNACGGMTLFKGAPERLLPYIRYTLGEDGRKVPFDADAFLSKMNALTADGARVIVAAFSDGTRGNLHDLTLICGIAMADKIRHEARRSVEALRGAGIGVVMITGDNRDTAVAIAEKCGILTKERHLCLTSDEMAAISDSCLGELLPHLAVVARALPTDKSRLVRIAQEAELVVGMTGDGINDAPALKRADIGFSMGSGSQVAKEAGDIIILDNNLASVVKAVLYGRNIFKSIRKFIVFQLTMNFCAVGVSMICPFFGIEAPITVVQMLWINIIMDTLGGLAFAGEAPLPSCMKEKPKRREEPILCSYMINQILLLGGFTIALSLYFLKSPAILSRFRTAPNDIYTLTAFFAFFIFAGVFNCFNTRTDRIDLFSGLGRNKAFLAIMPTVLAIQIAFTYFGGNVLRTAPLLPRELSVAFFMALLVFPAEFLRKLFWKFVIKKSRY